MGAEREVTTKQEIDRENSKERKPEKRREWADLPGMSFVFSGFRSFGFS
jgi:hypothetical protein